MPTDSPALCVWYRSSLASRPLLRANKAVAKLAQHRRPKIASALVQLTSAQLDNSDEHEHVLCNSYMWLT